MILLSDWSTGVYMQSLSLDVRHVLFATEHQITNCQFSRTYCDILPYVRVMFDTQMSETIIFLSPGVFGRCSRCYLLNCAMLPATRLNFLKTLDILYFELIMYESDLCVG